MQGKLKFQSVILTGFKTFGDHSINPTEVIVNSITPEEMKEHHISKKLTLDVTCKDVDCFTDQLLGQFENIGDQSTLLIHMGVGPNIIYYLEQCAYNNKDFRIPDNAGYQPTAQQICHNTQLDCPLDTKLNLKEIAQTLKKNYKVYISNDPGRYLCNYIYFCSMNKLGCKNNVTCLFVHIPTPHYTSPAKNKQFIFDLIETIQHGN